MHKSLQARLPRFQPTYCSSSRQPRCSSGRVHHTSPGSSRTQPSGTQSLGFLADLEDRGRRGDGWPPCSRRWGRSQRWYKRLDIVQKYTLLCCCSRCLWYSREDRCHPCRGDPADKAAGWYILAGIPRRHRSRHRNTEKEMNRA